VKEGLVIRHAPLRSSITDIRKRDMQKWCRTYVDVIAIDVAGSQKQLPAMLDATTYQRRGKQCSTPSCSIATPATIAPTTAPMVTTAAPSANLSTANHQKAAMPAHRRIPE
jgi:hypothetical protein